EEAVADGTRHGAVDHHSGDVGGARAHVHDDVVAVRQRPVWPGGGPGVQQTLWHLRDVRARAARAVVADHVDHDVRAAGRGPAHGQVDLAVGADRYDRR